MIIKESPLQGMKLGSVATVAIREWPGIHTLDLRVAPGTAAHAAVVEALGMDLPATTGQSRSKAKDTGSEVQALCLAPDWWLITGFEEAVQKLKLLQSQSQHHFSVVDVSGQRTTIELEGPMVRDLLAHLWEQDLREKTFPVAAVSQGLMAKAPVILYRIAPLRFRVMVRSSFALHLWKVLEDAAAEWA